MDTSDYLPMFLAESREHLQELNLAVVRLEENPEDRAVLDEIFRAAHSLKGMSATMGFSEIAALTHKMEDVFELLRQRSSLPSEIVDVLLACLDALESAVDHVESHGTEDLESPPLIERLLAVVRDEDARAQGTVGDDLSPVLLIPAGSAHHRAIRVRTILDDDVSMPSVRAYQVAAALAEQGDVLACVPDPDDLDAFDGRVVEAIIDTELEDEAIVAAVHGIAEVASVDIAAAQEEPVAAAEAGAEGAGRKSATTLRVDAERLDQLMHAMGELVVHRTRVEALAAEAEVPGLSKAIQELARSTQALHHMVMQIRMVPVEAVFLRFPRLVRDLSTKLGKDVDLRLVGKDTELDRTVVEKLGDPIVHLIRNALDHGLESPDERAAASKPRTGTVELSARHAGGNVVISVGDDGRGIDAQLVARRAAERGLIPAEAVDSIDVPRAIELLFTPGFTTVGSTTDISGRGVGMDAVRTRIRELGGDVVMRSEPGRGTLAQIRLPLTLAITNALLVDVDGHPYAIALDRVERSLSLAGATVRSVGGNRMLVLRDGVYPIIDARAALGCHDEAAVRTSTADLAVLVRAGERRIALAVSRLVGQQELVTRPLPAQATSSAVSAAAVLPDGTIALLVDCDALAAGAGGAASPSPTTALQEA